MPRDNQSKRANIRTATRCGEELSKVKVTGMFMSEMVGLKMLVTIDCVAVSEVLVYDSDYVIIFPS